MESSIPGSVGHLLSWLEANLWALRQCSAKDIIPFCQVRARLTNLAEEASAREEKIITRNGESYVALIDAHRLDYYHQLKREHTHLYKCPVTRIRENPVIDFGAEFLRAQRRCMGLCGCSLHRVTKLLTAWNRTANLFPSPRGFPYTREAVIPPSLVALPGAR